MAQKKHNYPDDLFEGTKMTFGEHLEELRKCLFRAIVGMILIFIVVLILRWPQWAVDFIQSPLKQALEDFRLERSASEVDKLVDAIKREGLDTPDESVLVETIHNSRATPVMYYFDPREVLQDSAQTYALSMPRSGIGGINGADIVGSKTFCSGVYAQRDREGAPGHRIWQAMSDRAKALIRSGAEEGLSRDEKQILAAELQSKVIEDEEFLVETRGFYDAIAEDEPWLGLTITSSQEKAKLLAERMQALLAKADGGEIETQPLNRRLLAMAYPDGVAAGPQLANMIPVTFWRPVADDPRVAITSLSPHEMFMIWLKAAFLVSLVVSSPWVFYQIWNFVGAGLYPHEKRYVHIFLPFSILLFAGGACLCFFFVFEPVLGFLFMFNQQMNVDPDMRISEWFGFAIFLPLGFGIAFQLPLVMLFLERIGVFNVRVYLSKWRISVLVIFILSMVLTPADPYSMILLAIPLTFLYFGGVLLCRYLPKGRNPFREVEEPE